MQANLALREPAAVDSAAQLPRLRHRDDEALTSGFLYRGA